MKKLALIFLLIVNITACKKEEKNEEPENYSASFTIVMDGSNFHTANSVDLKRIFDSNDNLKTILVSDDGGGTTATTGLSITGFSKTTGQSVPIGNHVSVLLKGNNFDNYFAAPWIQSLENGTVTRTAKDKVSFNGTFTGRNGNQHTVSGYIQSDGIK